MLSKEQIGCIKSEHFNLRPNVGIPSHGHSHGPALTLDKYYNVYFKHQVFRTGRLKNPDIQSILIRVYLLIASVCASSVTIIIV